MAHEDFESYVREMTYRSASNFTLLNFGALALSFQYSHTLGNNYLFVLILSWVLFIVSGFAGGWIVIYSPVFYRNNLFRVRAENMLEHLQSYQEEVVSGLHPEWTTKTLNKAIEDEKKVIEKTNYLMKRVDKFQLMMKIQSITFMLAIITNGIFASINLLLNRP